MKVSEILGLRRPRFSLLAAGLLVLWFASASWAQVDYYWNANSGDWGTAANWNPNGVPGAGVLDNAYLQQDDANHRTVNYRNTFAVAPTLAGVAVHASGAGTMTLDLTQAGAAGDLVTQNAWIGQAQVHQTAGALTVTSELILADSFGETATYNLEGGTLTPTYLNVGNYGTGIFNQSETLGIPTTVAVTNGHLSLGANANNAVGTYTLAGGTLATPYTHVGDSGTGTFWQNGGTHTVDNELNLGHLAGSGGTYNLAGGTLTTGATHVGYLGAGTFNQDGGDHNVTGNFFVGIGGGITGTYNQNGGTLNVGWEAYLGQDANSRGEYNLQGGDFSATNLVVGVSGIGAFTQSEPGPNFSTVTVNGNLNLGQNAGSSGDYDLLGGILLTAYTNVGGEGAGIFTHSDGIHAVTNELYLGVETTGSGTYNLSNTGILATSNTIVGNSGIGVFNQSGGGHLVANVLTLGMSAGGSGAYNLTAGALAADYAFIGDNGNGVFTQSQTTPTPTTVTIDSGMGVGRGDTSNSIYNLQGGTLDIGDAANPGNLWVGANGIGLFNQTGGTLTVTGNTTLGEGLTGQGEYRLQAGTFNAQSLDVGGQGIGIFNQSAGTTLNVTNDIMINSQAGTSTFTQAGGDTFVPTHLGVGRDQNGRGQYLLQGGNLVVGDLFVGHGGTGDFTQTGGALLIQNSIWLASELSGRATMDLQGGTLTFADPNAGSLNVGQLGIGEFIQHSGVDLLLNTMRVNSQSGTSTFTQIGGTTTVNDHLVVGEDVGSHGLYTLQDGTLNTGQIYLGWAGTGAFTQQGGTVNVAQDLWMGDAGAGIFNLVNGNLNTNNTRVGIGGAGSVFHHSGGTHSVFNTLVLAENPGSSGTYNLSSNGILNVNTINLNAGGIFNQTGGTLNAATFNHQGGEVQGSLQNQGIYNYTNGLFTGRLLNFGAANFNADFTAGNGMGLFSLHTLDAGRSLTFNGQGLEVDQGGIFIQTGGTLSLTNGIIGNTGNGSFHQLDGDHTVTGNLTVGANAGGIGVYNMGGGTHTVTNILTLAANLGSAGTYNLLGGTLSAGTININVGGLFDRIGGTLNFTNLNLVGGTYQGDLDNSATVTGTGQIVGNLINRGIVNPGNSAGTLQVQGSFTQAATGNYVLEIESATNYDKIEVTGAPLVPGAPGTAAVAGTLTPTLLGGYNPAPNTLFQGIVTATGGITGQFTTIDSTLPWKLLYYANSIDLLLEMLAPPAINPRIAFNYADPSFPLTGNQRNLGAVFNAVKDSASGDLGSVLDIIRQLPNGNAVANAYQQISPDKASAMPNLSLATSMMQWRNLTNRMSYLRWGYGSRQTFAEGGGSGNLGCSYSRLSGLMLAYNGADLSSLLSGKPQEPHDGNRWGIYTDFVATIGNLNSSVVQTGYDFNVFGFNSGIDYRLRDNLIIGLGSGYYHTATNFKGSGGNSEVNSIPFFAYGLYYPNSFYAMGSIGYTLNLYGLNRNLTFGTLRRVADSSVTGSQFNVSGEAGYDVAQRGFILTPAVSLYYSKAWIDSYSESGADSLNLKVSAQSADSLQTGVGVRVARPFKAGNTQIVPQASAFYQHEFANNSRGMDARLPQAGTGFGYKTVSPRRDFAVLGAGVAVGLKKNLFIQANYNAEVGRGNSSAHFVSAGLKWTF